MMNNVKKIIHNYHIILTVFALITSSCTKVIDLKLNNAAGQLVIEGNITNISGAQYIKLSKNVPFTNTNTYPPVTGAYVSVIDQNGKNHFLTEVSPGTYSFNTSGGIAGNTYKMYIQVNGQTYQASSTMPATVALDSVTAQNSAFKNSNNRKDIVVHYQDPSGIANQYRFVMYVNNIQIKRVYTFDDEFSDGKYLSLILNQNDIDIYPGDTVTVEMQGLDKPIYQYWFTLMQQQDNGPGGSVTPSNPPNNITPDALGYFSAHTTQSETIVVR
jgi:hypothetical protein